MEKFYTGINIKKLFNKKVIVGEIIDFVGTNRDIPVYNCTDENGKNYKIMGATLSDAPVQGEYKYAYGGMGDCFPESVERFPSFSKSGKYLFESIWD